MANHYQLLCQLAQQHDYFENPHTASVRLVPTPDTAHRLQRAGLWTKKGTRGELVVMRDESATAGRPLPEFLFPLRFLVQPLSPYFENFTTLPDTSAADSGPAVGGRAIYYFSPRAGKKALVQLKGQGALRLPLSPLTLTFQCTASLEPLALVRLLAVERPRSRYLDLPVDQAGRVNVDVRRWGPGRYQLRAGRTILLDFYADEQLYAAQAWGVIEIGAKALSLPPLTVQLTFAARRTRWKYLVRYQHAVAKKYQEAPGSLSVTATAKPGTKLPAVEFAAVPPPPGIDLAFESAKDIALAERPGYTYALLAQRPVPLTMALPAAGVELVRLPHPAPADAPPGPTYSEIYFHF